MVQRGDFPRAKQFGLQKSYWLRTDVEAFIAKLEAQETAPTAELLPLTAARIQKNLAEKKEKVRGNSEPTCA